MKKTSETRKYEQMKAPAEFELFFIIHFIYYSSHQWPVQRILLLKKITTSIKILSCRQFIYKEKRTSNKMHYKAYLEYPQVLPWPA